MAWQVDPDGRLRAGLVASDPSQDVQIQSYMDASMRLAETHCDRVLWNRALVEEVRPAGRRASYLYGYPVTAFVHLQENGNDYPENEYNLQLQEGLLRWKVPQAMDLLLEASYTAGFDVSTMPGDLELALWQIWDDIRQGFEVSETAEGGRIKSINIQGVGAITYDFNPASRLNSDQILPLLASELLRPYRRMRV